MTILVGLGGEPLQKTTIGPRNCSHERMNVEPSSQLGVAIDDAIAEFQSLDKLHDIKDYKITQK